jgi:hypothetical protein
MKAAIVARTTMIQRTVPKASSTPRVWRIMWRRLRRRTMAPSRPAMYPDQLGLVLLTAAVIGLGIYVFVQVLV